MLSASSRLIFSLLIFSLVLVGCSTSSIGTADETTPPATELPTQTPTPTEPPPPTPTSQPPLVILVASPDGDRIQINDLQSTLSELSTAAGLRFQVRPALSPAEIVPEVHLVVALHPDPGVVAMAASAPQTQFVGVNIPGIEPSGNISVIGPEGATPDRLGFLAGYIAAVISTDWRSGVMSTIDTPAGKAYRNGFLNGAVFFCGLCNPAYPPFINYPQYVELQSGASQAEWQLVADVVNDNFVQTVFVAPSADGEQLLSYLTGLGINIIGGVNPPDELRTNWVATVHADATTAIQQIWPDLIAGNGGFRLPLAIKYSQVNHSLFSPGRQRLTESIRSDLQDGFIDTGVDPLTGEIR